MVTATGGAGAFLEDVTVLEVGNGVPVGFAGRVLRSLGATVIKVEARQSLDWVREYGAPSTVRGSLSCAAVHLHGAKPRVIVDGSPTPAGLAALLAPADVVLVGDGPLAAAVPAPEAGGAFTADVFRIVGATALSNAAGPAGPLAADESAGVAAGMRDPFLDVLPPSGMRFDLCEVNAGLHVAAMAALALARPDRSVPVDLEVGVYEATFSIIEILSELIITADHFGAEVPNFLGGPMAAPFVARDGNPWVLNLYGRGVWGRMCVAMERPDLTADARYAEQTGRTQNVATLRPLLDEWSASVDRDEIIRRLRAQRIPAAPILSAADLPSLRHLRDRGIFQEHAGGGQTIAGALVIDGARDALPLCDRAQALSIVRALGLRPLETPLEVDLDAVLVSLA